MLVRHNEHSYLLILKCHLGTGDATKMDEFSEKLQTAFLPSSVLVLSPVPYADEDFKIPPSEELLQDFLPQSWFPSLSLCMGCPPRI